MIDDLIERELLKIHALCDILATVKAELLEKDTLTAIAVIIQEAVKNIRGFFNGRKKNS